MACGHGRMPRAPCSASNVGRFHDSVVTKLEPLPDVNVAMCLHVCTLCASANEKWVAGGPEVKLKASCMSCSGRD